MDLSRFPRRRYTHAPTPIELLPHFTKALAASCPGGVGPEIWIKRDDMLGLFPGGNKTRKLEFLAADAMAHGADTLITCGAPQSNHCRITLAAAVKEGLKCRFVIEERVPNSYDVNASGNNFMFRLLGVEAITVVPGGTHADGATHNALVVFADGAYIELPAWRAPAPEERWWQQLQQTALGTVTLQADSKLATGSAVFVGASQLHLADFRQRLDSLLPQVQQQLLGNSHDGT